MSENTCEETRVIQRMVFENTGEKIDLTKMSKEARNELAMATAMALLKKRGVKHVCTIHYEYAMV